jgi:hypothetical protein
VAKLKHRIVITTHRPGRRQALVAAAMIALLVAGFGIYRYTRATTVSDFEKAQSERDQLMEERRAQNRELRQLRSENAQLKEQAAYLNRSQEIDVSACDTVKKSLAQLQAESADLREQLAFYRGIVSPQGAQTGVRVYDFKAYRQKTPGQFRYDLVLIQSARNDKRVGGIADIRIEGLKGSQKQLLRLADVATDAGKNLLFSFRYFQEFGGQIKLPDGFRPLRVTIVLQPESEAAPVEDQYEWAKIEQQEASRP